MSDMKCPICNKQMKIGTIDIDDSMGTVWMSIMPCDCVCSYGASKAIWQELIRTRKVLDVAMDGIKRIEKLTEPSYKDRNLEALALAVNTFSGEIIEQINQRNNN